MPKSLMAEIEKGSVEVENEKLDMEDLSQAYETGADETENTRQQGQQAGLGGEYEQPAV